MVFSFSYVNSKGWHHYFKTYCIPEDLVPRILSPAYFHHYNAQAQTIPAEAESTNLSPLKRKEGEQLVLGLGPVQRSFWRLSRLVPLESVRRKFNKYGGNQVGSVDMSSPSDSVATALVEDDVVEPESLEIQEGLDGISLKPFSDIDKGPPDVATSGKLAEQGNIKAGDGGSWLSVPYLPSYVPFGQVLIRKLCLISHVLFDCVILYNFIVACRRGAKVADIIEVLMLMVLLLASNLCFVFSWVGLF